MDLGRFLQPPNINPHATLLTLFMNAVDEEMTEADDRQSLTTEQTQVSRYIPATEIPRSIFDPTIYMLDAARSIVRDNDKYFDRSVTLNLYISASSSSQSLGTWRSINSTKSSDFLALWSSPLTLLSINGQ